MTDGLVARTRGQVLTVRRGTTFGQTERSPVADSRDFGPRSPAQGRPVQGDFAQGNFAQGKLARGELARGLGLVCVLPMFAQCFHYMTDIPPLYLLSKVWPFLMAPLFLWALLNVAMPYKALHVTTLFWLLAVTPMIGILHLGNSFADAMATTVKVWPFTYAFAAAGMLVILRPDPLTLRRIIVGLGVATFVIMQVLWIAVPQSAYGGGDLETKLFMTDVERGFRIYMPMFFGLLLIFYLNRSAWIRFAWWKPAAIVVAFVLLFAIYKQRAAIAGAVLAVVVGSAFSLKRWRLAAFMAIGLGAVSGLAVLIARSQMSSNLKTSLGASLAVREVSVATAWEYISTDPLRWVLGVGGTTRLGEVTLAKLFNNPMFYLADIGWLGVLFEYGMIGVTLMLLLHFAGLRLALGWARPGDPLSQALVDYIVYLLAVSIVYSAVFTPGELMTVMALSYYLALSSPGMRMGQGTGLSQPPSVRPRQTAWARALPLGLSGGPPSGRARSG